MRVILAAVTFWFGMMFVAGLLGDILPKRACDMSFTDVLITFVVVGATTLILLAAVSKLFNKRIPDIKIMREGFPSDFNVHQRFLDEKDQLDQRLDWATQHGKAGTTTYRARRAFGIENHDTGVLVYFVETSDTRVMVFHGAYLFAYEPSKVDERARERTFPSDVFEVVRNEEEGDILKITPLGHPLEPDMFSKPDYEKLFNALGYFSDGEIYNDVDYDDLRTTVFGA